MDKLFESVDLVLIKDKGVYEDKAMSDIILLAISETDKIQRLNQLLEFEESIEVFYCLCLGSYAIELHRNTQLIATIGFHHGSSIRYHKWNGDAVLAKSDDLLTFLTKLGFLKPLEDRMAEKRNMEADRIAERNWLGNAPQSFKKYWNQIHDDLDSSFLIHLLLTLIQNSQIGIK